jgi:guanine deaminase
MTIGDDRAVRVTYIAGECVYGPDRNDEKFRYPA